MNILIIIKKFYSKYNMEICIGIFVFIVFVIDYLKSIKFDNVELYKCILGNTDNSNFYAIAKNVCEQEFANQKITIQNILTITLLIGALAFIGVFWYALVRFNKRLLEDSVK